jgi:hypothetical protein
MREIKFRAWAHRDGIWIEPSLLAITCNGRPFFKDSGEDYNRASELVLMQSTGLHDKHGKEIYEGDVLLDGQRRMAVRFEEGAFRFGDDGRSPGHSESLGLRALQSEIIGNIYENPDLLPPSPSPADQRQ